MKATANVVVSELLVSVANADRQAFRSLYAKAGPTLYAICLRMMKSRDQADDVLQEAFVKIWERSWQFDPGKGDGLAWLATLTRHCALDRLRRQPKAQLALDEDTAREVDEASPVLPPDHALTADLGHCLQALREDYRRAVVLAYVNGYTHEELAEHLDKPLGTIKSWVKRGLEQLKDCMDR
jgi:RNA polymerase sigma-70 factor (ECF subfamily)